MYAFIDESGDCGLDFSKSRAHFITPAVLIEDKKFGHERLLDLKSRLKINGSLKKYKDREGLLNALSQEPFTYFILVVDKRKISKGSGLSYKKSFYKFVAGILYNNLYKTRRELFIYPDKLIDADYIRSFEEYIDENHTITLFNQGSVYFPKSDIEEEPLLELPDLISNALARYYSGESSLNPYEILGKKIIGQIVFPAEEIKSYTVEEEGDDSYSKEIVDTAILRIADFINKNSSNREPIIQDQVNTLQFLLNTFYYHSNRKYLHAFEIVRYLQAGNTDREISEQYLRTSILGPLKSAGILLSCTNDGYKIPKTKREVIAFFNLYSRQIAPMIARLSIARNSILAATNGELDMFEFEEYSYLKKITK